MCSVGDDVEENINAKFMPEKVKFSFISFVFRNESKCGKCKIETPQVVLSGQYLYCKNCFLTGTIHKFKSIIGKNRIVKPNETIVVHHKAGHPSTALLHFLRSGLNLTTPKRIRFNVIVVYIENRFKFTVEKRRSILKQIKEEVDGFKFPLFFVSLTQFALNPTNLSNYLVQDFEKVHLDPQDGINLKNIMKTKSNSTIQSEIFKIYERDLLISSAKILNCAAVFTPELGVDIASQLLTTISLGRGAHVTYEVGTVDSRDSEVSILRPLRNFTIKELALYNFYNNLEPTTFMNKAETFDTSVQSLMNKFVTNLQINYPATISTIVRTGDKLCIGKKLEFCKKCELCKAPIENDDHKLSSSEATSFSHSVSLQAVPIEESIKIEEVSNKQYCFACENIAKYLL